jgi:peptide/nickel transport system substrate-binding protein
VRTTVVVDAKTLRFELKRPYPHLPSVLSSLRGGIVLPRGAESKIDLATQAIGTGPFKLKTFAQNERLVYERNTAYRAKDVPKVDGMVARVMPDENDRIVALRSGAIDYAALSPEGLRKLGQSREIQVVGGPRAWLATIDLPYNTHAAFRDARVRRAFSLAIDREEIVKKTLLGAGALSGFVPTGFWDYALTEADLRPRVRRDVDEAKALLADAGFPGGKGFPEVKLVASPDYPEFLSNARLVQAQLRDVGLNLEIQQVDWGSYVALVNKGDVQLGFSASTFYPDPDLYLWPIGHSQSLRGVRGYRHQNQAELDKLLDDARTFLGPREQRRELFHRADRMLLDDPPMLPLYVAASIEAVSSRVKGYTSSFTGRKPAFRNVVLG